VNILEIIESEGDYFEWVYTAKNEVEFKCFWRRNKTLKHLCGYVILDKYNNFFGKCYDDIPVQVHGGLTYSEEEDGYWVVGFDCAHSGDLVPYLIQSSLDLKISLYGVYRDRKFVEAECENLAEQLSEWSLSKIRDIKLGKLI
jgi:hypothetical protein